jgi:transposase
MNCQQLAERIQQLEPVASPGEIARICLLISNSVERLESLNTAQELVRAWRETGLKIQAATDQHAAMTEELEQLAQSNPEKFSKDQVWILIRAIKVQSQILQLYLGGPALDV